MLHLCLSLLKIRWPTPIPHLSSLSFSLSFYPIPTPSALGCCYPGLPYFFFFFLKLLCNLKERGPDGPLTRRMEERRRRGGCQRSLREGRWYLALAWGVGLCAPPGAFFWAPGRWDLKLHGNGPQDPPPPPHPTPPREPVKVSFQRGWDAEEDPSLMLLEEVWLWEETFPGQAPATPASTSACCDRLLAEPSCLGSAVGLPVEIRMPGYIRTSGKQGIVFLVYICPKNLMGHTYTKKVICCLSKVQF